LHRLRQVIGNDAVLFAEQRLSLDARRVWVDVWCFERYLTQLNALLSQGNTAGFVSQLAESLAIYRQPFLDGDEADWAITQRERLRDKVLRLLSQGAETLSRAQLHADAMACCERALDIEPLAEAVYRALMKSQLTLGERAAAIATYRRCQTVLQRELGVKPAAATEALYRQAMQ
jgi:two-component SAPR family response regulator